MKRFGFRLPSAIGLFLSLSGMPVSAAPADINTVPASWTRYATLVAQQLQQQLGDKNDPRAIRFHRYLEDLGAEDAQTPVLNPITRIWIDRGGSIARVEFDSLGAAQADEDLRHILTAQPLLKPPPRGFRQPIILRLKLSYLS
jgi:hypothetical protein